MSNIEQLEVEVMELRRMVVSLEKSRLNHEQRLDLHIQTENLLNARIDTLTDALSDVIKANIELSNNILKATTP